MFCGFRSRWTVFAVDVLHGDEGHAFGLADVVDAADVGVGNLARDADLAVEAFEQAEIVGGLFGQEFEGDRLAEGEVGGAVNFTHAAAAQQSDDAVTAGNQGTGNEAAFFGG